MYLLYIDHVLFPVAPKKIVTQTQLKNQVVSLIDGSEIVLKGGCSLRKFNFELLLPMQNYPFAVYESGYKDATYFIGELERIAQDNSPVWFDLYRTMPTMEKTYVTNILTIPDEITFEENADNGLDFKASVTLTEYRTSKSALKDNGQYSSQTRSDDMKTPYTYTVKSGDTLWLIAKQFLGSGDKYLELAQINSLQRPYTIQVGQVIKLRE